MLHPPVRRPLASAPPKPGVLPRKYAAVGLNCSARLELVGPWVAWCAWFCRRGAPKLGHGDVKLRGSTAHKRGGSWSSVGEVVRAHSHKSERGPTKTTIDGEWTGRGRGHAAASGRLRAGPGWSDRGSRPPPGCRQHSPLLKPNLLVHTFVVVPPMIPCDLRCTVAVATSRDLELVSI